jgi:hypothetical protein
MANWCPEPGTEVKFWSDELDEVLVGRVVVQGDPLALVEVPFPMNPPLDDPYNFTGTWTVTRGMLR